MIETQNQHFILTVLSALLSRQEKLGRPGSQNLKHFIFDFVQDRPLQASLFHLVYS